MGDADKFRKVVGEIIEDVEIYGVEELGYTI